MATPFEITLWIYNLTLFPIIFVSVLFLVLCAINLFIDKKAKKNYPEFKDLPFVTVQIPTFNDPIAVRCIEACLKLDYPKDKHEIFIVDDSTNRETQELLKNFTKYDNVKYIYRDNRSGYKPGALKNSMKYAKGEIIVVFDSDWVPAPDFIKKIIKPFNDKNVAIVQTRQGFLNKDTNLITKFAAYSLMAYHAIIMPINNKINCVFFCGTAGALRRSAFEEVGGWNLSSITEDSDLSVKLLKMKYKSVYLDFETPSEVPDTFEGFIKQQMRWCYGNTRVFMDNLPNIFLKKGLSLKQRIMITYLTFGNITAPIVVLMTFFGFAGWFLGEPALMSITDLWTFLIRFACSRKTF